MIDLLKIKDPSFLKNMNVKELESLAIDIRNFLIENVSKSGGHLSPNLGVVELTIAMHQVFDSPKDKLLFDVGHQCYTHKILTGRANDFAQLRKYGGISGFIKRSESEHDIWESGHSSTSISAQCGYLYAGSSGKVVALIGDSSIANGVSFEALNYMGSLKHKNPIIILNDNKMSISKSVGSISRTFSKLRSTKFYQNTNSFFAKYTPKIIRAGMHRLKNSIKGLILKENIFEDWGYDYMGPYDGNNIAVCLKVLNAAKELNKPCVIHFVTKKGNGYPYAEMDTDGSYHSVSPFDVKTGKSLSKINFDRASYAKIASDKIEELIAIKERYVITPAMIKGSHLVDLQKRYPQNIIDVGMAEEHATVMASALSQANKSVILMLYSTFAQRAYDYFLNDIARTNTPMLIAIDHADFVSNDGETHQGVYDLSMWAAMPNVQVTMPRDGNELASLFTYALNQKCPVVVRYPKAETSIVSEEEKIERPSWLNVKEGNDIIVIAYGNNIDYVLEAIKDVRYDVKIINARFIRPMDIDMLSEIVATNKPILVYENCIFNGSLSSYIYRYIMDNNINAKIKSMTLDDQAIVPCGSLEELRKHFNLSKENIVAELKKLMGD